MQVTFFLRKKCDRFSCRLCLLNTFPILKWLPKYKWRENILHDAIAGLTVATMHIPQGMAYGLLANILPICGIYMAFFPVLVYIIFGTSRHASMGTFSIVCLMTGNVVLSRISNTGQEHIEEQIQIAITVTFTVALILIAMYILRLGILAVLLSDTLVNGFTCGCSYYVFASQFSNVFSIVSMNRESLFSLPLTIYNSVRDLPNANVATVITSTANVIFLITAKFLKPLLAKITKFPIPFDLILIGITTTLSYFLQFDETYKIHIIGYIPTGIPSPTIPLFNVIPEILGYCIVITVVSYSVTMSMALLFARKDNYEIDANQELLAMGLSNTVGAFFSSPPITASLARSVIQYQMGGVSQLTSLVSCFILLFVLLWIGPVFQPVPKCTLSSIILVQLWPIFSKVKTIPVYWRINKWDFAIWITAFGVTTAVSPSYGLGAGIVAAVAMVSVKGFRMRCVEIGVSQTTGEFVEIDDEIDEVEEVKNIKIYRIKGPINYISRRKFRYTFNDKIRFKEKLRGEEVCNFGMVILDLTSCHFIDFTGIASLNSLCSRLQQIGVDLCVVGCTGSVAKMFDKCKDNKTLVSFEIDATISDAVSRFQSSI